MLNFAIPYGAERKILRADLPPENVIVATSKDPAATRTWTDLAEEALRSPVGAEPIREHNLRGKKVAVITDDLARSTDAAQIIPLVLRELAAAGAEKRNITFITATGMHDPLDHEGLIRKLGRPIVEEYRCAAHDGGNPDEIVFLGTTPNGTPIWVNRHVAEAEYRIGINRIYPHETHGYEGGYKLILPGVSGFATIARNHSLNDAPDYGGSLSSPSRRDTDEVGAAVGIGFLINVVVNAHGQPVKAFAGEPMVAFRFGVAYGDHEVWGAEVGPQADIVVASSGRGAPFVGDIRCSWTGLLTLYRAARVAKVGGTVIWVAPEEMPFDGMTGQELADDTAIAALDLRTFVKLLDRLSFAEIVRLHEKRNWPLDAREVMWRMRELRGEFLRRRRIAEIAKRTTLFTPDPDATLRRVLAEQGTRSVRLVVLPEAATTLAKETLYRYAED